MLIRQHLARALTAAREAEHRHRRLQLRPRQQLRNSNSYRDGYSYSYRNGYGYSYNCAQGDAYAEASWDSATAAIADQEQFCRGS